MENKNSTTDQEKSQSNSEQLDKTKSFLQKSATNTKDLVTAAFLLAVIILLSLTPLGFVRLPLLPELTILHVPVIIGSILLGLKYGAFLGFAFGMSSFLNATFAPGLISFAFSPYYSVGDIHGNAWSLVVAFLPRILVGITPWLAYKGLGRLLKFKGSDSISLAVSGVVGSLTNTIIVLGLIGIFFTKEFSTLMGTTSGLLFKGILGIVATNGIPEAILAGVITVAVCKAVLISQKRLNNNKS